jgi:hypothetical protein
MESKGNVSMMILIMIKPDRQNGKAFGNSRRAECFMDIYQNEISLPKGMSGEQEAWKQLYR